MRPTLPVALCALALVFDAGNARATNSVVFQFEEGGDTLSFTAPATIDGVLHGRNMVRSCRYDMGVRGKDLLKAFLDRDVQAALHANMPQAGDAARLVAGNDAIDWRPQVTTASPTSIRLLRLQLRVEMIKARIRCPV